MSPADPTYRLKYDLVVERGHFTEADLGKCGGTDALIVGSVIRTPDGGSSTAWFSRDGETDAAFTAVQLFTAWTMLASVLAQRDDLPPQQRQIARGSLEAVRHSLGVTLQ